MKSAWVTGCLVAFAAAALAAPPGPPEQLAWAPGLAAAQEDARQRKVPLLVVLNMDGERGNERMLAEVYTASAVRAAAKKCAVTIASLGKHAEVDDPKRGAKACSRFGLVTCDEHRATEKVVREEWLKCGPKDDVDSPRHIFRAPDGRPLFDRVWTLDAEELVKLIDRAVLACAPESLAAWDTTDARLRRAFEPLWCVRTAALKDLLAARDPAVDAKLFELARHTDNGEAAEDIVNAMAFDLTPARGAMIRKLLTAPSAVVRMNVAAQLASQKEKDAFDLLAAAFATEKAADVKCVMLRALAVSGGDPAKTRDFMLKAAKPGDDVVRVHAVVALAPWAKEDAVVDAIRKIPANEKLPENLRSAAAWTLGLSGRKELVEELRGVAADRTKILKRAIEAAVAQLSSGADVPNYMYLRAWIAPLSVSLPEK
jgi:hypothetical protein